MRCFVLAVFAVLMSAAPGFAEGTAPDTSAIEAAHAAWTQKTSKKNRKALDKALEAYEGPPTAATVKAHLAIVGADSNGKSASKLRKSSLAAANHLQPAANVLPKQYLELKYLAATALFNSERNKDALVEMTHIEGLAYKLRQSNEEADPNESAFRDIYNRADAWGMAIGSYLESSGKQSVSRDELEAILETYGADERTTNEIARTGEMDSDESGEKRLPFCRGGLKMRPKLKYPNSALNKGMVGAVIFKFDHDESGKIINPEVLASVPDEGFKAEALKTIKRWSYVAADDELPGETCRLERSNLRFPVVFALE